MYGNIFQRNYPGYMNTIAGFVDFHNNVINMPRANFTEIETFIPLCKSLAGYLNLLDDQFFNSGHNYKQIYIELYHLHSNGRYPDDGIRNYQFERTFFDREESPEFLYSDQGKLGRLFRHYMEYLSFFEIFRNGNNRIQKIINRDAVNELILTPDNNLKDILKNKMLWININNNDFFDNLHGISIRNDADYFPTHAILDYCNHINNRTITLYEIAVLLGRVDSMQKTDNILRRAYEVGSIFPTTTDQQIACLFAGMGWYTENGIVVRYRPSQNPNFKFKTYILLMQCLGLINYDPATKTVSLTDESRNLVNSGLPPEITDMDNLLRLIDDDSERSNRLMDILVNRRTDEITRLMQEPNSDLIVRLNQRCLREAQNNDGVRRRNKLISAVAKIKANNEDEVDHLPGFLNENNENYVEAHHIIEFNRNENGPDITDNLICLSPAHHAILTHGNDEAKSAFYRMCRETNAITLGRFINMITTYHCLTYQHLNILVTKNIITQDEANQLEQMIAEDEARDAD